MSRYIDADDLRHRVLYFADARNLNGNHEQAKAYNHCLIMIDESKTADVVEVVRCEDCRYWKNRFDVMVCNLTDGMKGAGDYCSYGERRENG